MHARLQPISALLGGHMYAFEEKTRMFPCYGVMTSFMLRGGWAWIEQSWSILLGTLIKAETLGACTRFFSEYRRKRT